MKIFAIRTAPNWVQLRLASKKPKRCYSSTEVGGLYRLRCVYNGFGDVSRREKVEVPPIKINTVYWEGGVHLCNVRFSFLKLLMDLPPRAKFAVEVPRSLHDKFMLKSERRKNPKDVQD